MKPRPRCFGEAICLLLVRLAADYRIQENSNQPRCECLLCNAVEPGETIRRRNQETVRKGN